MKKHKKLLVNLFVIVLLISLLAYLAIKFGDSLGHDSKAEKITPEYCLHIVTENSLVGKWADMGSDVPAATNLELRSDGSFTFTYKYIDGRVINGSSGQWGFNSEINSVKFTFDLRDDSLIEVLRNDLKSMYKNVISYSYSERYLELGIDYYANPNIADESCQPNRYFLDFLNIFLYKQAE